MGLGIQARDFGILSCKYNVSFWFRWPQIVFGYSIRSYKVGLHVEHIFGIQTNKRMTLLDSAYHSKGHSAEGRIVYIVKNKKQGRAV